MARHFLTGEELTAAEQQGLLDRAIELKADRLSSRALEGLSVALVFDKPSTRTRVSFETGVFQLRCRPLVLREGELQLSRGESARDTALVLSRMVHAIADLVTLRERFGHLDGLKLAYVGDGNNVARSLLIASRLAGVEFAISTPPELALPELASVPLDDA